MGSASTLIHRTPAEGPSRLVKSSQRVRDLGEVFTPAATVNDMLDMFPASVWVVHPAPTFLEPACGDGNFLTAILERKLNRVAKLHKRGKLPAGDTFSAAQFHALEALASIYAVDISYDNIVGGTPGHEVGARTRILKAFAAWHEDTFEKRLTDRAPALRAATWIVEHNLIVGNMLPYGADGSPTSSGRIPLIEYTFYPEAEKVLLRQTTLSDVVDAAQAENSTTPSLFGPAEPVFLWSGKALGLYAAARVAAPKLRGPARNGVGSGR